MVQIIQNNFGGLNVFLRREVTLFTFAPESRAHLLIKIQQRFKFNETKSILYVGIAVHLHQPTFLITISKNGVLSLSNDDVSTQPWLVFLEEKSFDLWVS